MVAQNTAKFRVRIYYCDRDTLLIADESFSHLKLPKDQAHEFLKSCDFELVPGSETRDSVLGVSIETWEKKT